MFLLLTCDCEGIPVKRTALGDNIDKGNTKTFRIFKPLPQSVGNDFQTAAGGFASCLDLVLKPTHPHCMAVSQECRQKVLFFDGVWPASTNFADPALSSACEILGPRMPHRERTSRKAMLITVLTPALCSISSMFPPRHLSWAWTMKAGARRPASMPSYWTRNLRFLHKDQSSCTCEQCAAQN